MVPSKIKLLIINLQSQSQLLVACESATGQTPAWTTSQDQPVSLMRLVVPELRSGLLWDHS